MGIQMYELNNQKSGTNKDGGLKDGNNKHGVKHLIIVILLSLLSLL